MAETLILASIIFFNGYVLADTERQEGEFFFQKWNEYVNFNQDSLVGKVGMKMLYFIPTLCSIISKCRYVLTRKESC